MVRVVVMEQVGLGEWNEKRRKENGQDAGDGMKQKVAERIYDANLQLLLLSLRPAPSHTRTVVRECYKDDCESLWKSLKFDPSPRKNGSTDRPPNLHR